MATNEEVNAVIVENCSVTLDNLIKLMSTCRLTDEASRVASLVGFMDTAGMSLELARVVGAVAINRLTEVRE